MCFSQEASIIALFVGLTGSYMLYDLGGIDNKIVGLFFAYVSLMQIIDAVLWKHQVCDDFHKQVSYAGMILNLTQPLVLGGLIYFYNKKAQFEYIIPLLIFYLLCFGVFLQQNAKTSKCVNPRPGDPNLVWSWTVQKTKVYDWSVYIGTLLLLFILGGTNLMRGIEMAILTLVGFILTFLFYPRQSIGSIWCFFTALAPPLMYLRRTWHQT